MTDGATKKYYNVKSRSQFDALLAENPDKPALIDFWATWCGPCKVTGPHFEAAARNMGDKVMFIKVNTEEARDLAQAFKIRSIPTLAAFWNGKVIDIHIGSSGQAGIEALANRAIKRVAKEKIKAAKAAGEEVPAELLADASAGSEGGLMGKIKGLFGA
jgi:thioredoxin 1